MTRKLTLKALLFIGVASLANQTFTLVDSTTDNQLPSMRDWQTPGIQDTDLEFFTDAEGNVNTEYKDKYSDIEEMQAGGDIDSW